MRMKYILLQLYSLFSIVLSAQPYIYNITDFGARSEKSFISTAAINKAIQICNKNGGGTVFVPPGDFISGTIILLSNVSLELSAGAKLIGSKDTADYLLIDRVLMPTEGYSRYGLLYANDVQNISISGKGEIDGQGTYFMRSPYQYKYIGRDFDAIFTRQGNAFMKAGTIIEDGPVTYSFRPGLLITMTHCENVSITDVTMKDSPEWTIRLGFCDGVKIRGITIDNNQLVPNNDGIHCTVSRNITISDCNIVAGDDAIIVSGFGDDVRPGQKFTYGNKTGIAENVTVTNCVLSSRSACIRIGYGEYPIRNLVFNNLVMYASNRGIGIFAREQSSIEHVLFSNIIINNRLHSGHWWGKGEPIHISAVKSKAEGKAGTINDIRFSHINAESEAGIILQGSVESHLTNVDFDNVSLQIKRGKYTDSYGGNFDFRPAYPLSAALYKHDIPGLYAQFVDHARFNHVKITWANDLPSFFTNGFSIDQFTDVTLENSFILPAHKNGLLKAIQFSNGIKPKILNCITGNGINLVSSK